MSHCLASTVSLEAIVTVEATLKLLPSIMHRLSSLYDKKICAVSRGATDGNLDISWFDVVRPGTWTHPSNISTSNAVASAPSLAVYNLHSLSGWFNNYMADLWHRWSSWPFFYHLSEIIPGKESQ